MEALLPLLPVGLAIVLPLLIGVDTRDGRDWQARSDGTWRSR
jgi:hypothetical protein